jgi:hypothetical protein
MLRDYRCACLHDENVFTLDLLEELHVTLNVLEQRFESDLCLDNFLYLMFSLTKGVVGRVIVILIGSSSD